jgi:hypothetical protein
MRMVAFLRRCWERGQKSRDESKALVGLASTTLQFLL